MLRTKTFHTNSFSTRNKRFHPDLYEIKFSFVKAKMIVVVKIISTHVIKLAGIIRQPTYLKLQKEIAARYFELESFHLRLDLRHF